MPDEPSNTVIDTSNLPIVAGNSEQGDSPQELMARFEALETATKAPAKVEKPEPVQKVEDEPEPKVEIEKVETEPTQPVKTKKTAEIIKELHTERDQLAKDKAAIEQERETLRQQLEELKKDDPAIYKRQIEEKDKALTDYEQKVALLDVKASKEYETAVLLPFEAIGRNVATIAETYEVNPAAIQQALLNPDPAAQRKALNELISEFSDADKAEIMAHAREVRALSTKAAELESKAVEAKKEVEFRRHQEAEESKKTESARMKQAGEKVWETMAEKLPLLKDATVAEQVRKAELDPKDPAMKAYNAYAGMALPVLAKTNQELTAKVAELQAALDARASARPGAGTSTVTTTPTPTEGMPEGESVADRFASWQRQNAA